jgi:hypothetical protein
MPSFLQKLFSGKNAPRGRGPGGRGQDGGLDSATNAILQIAGQGVAGGPGGGQPASFAGATIDQIQPGVAVLESERIAPSDAGGGPTLATTAGSGTLIGATTGGGTAAQPTLNTVGGVGTPNAPTLDFRSRPSYAEGGLVQPGGPPQGGLAPQGAVQQQSVGMKGMEAEMQRMVQQNPKQILQMRDLIMQGIQNGEVTMEELNMGVQLATAAAQNPELWPQLRQFAIQQGLGTEQEIPQQYDEGLVFSLLLGARAIQQQGPQGGGQPAMPQQGPQGGGQPAMPQGPIPQAAGQPAPGFMSGGALPKDSRNTDGSIPITAHEGEYVIPEDIVRRKGTDFFDKMIGKDNVQSA